MDELKILDRIKDAFPGKIDLYSSIIGVCKYREKKRLRKKGFMLRSRRKYQRYQRKTCFKTFTDRTIDSEGKRRKVKVAVFTMRHN